MTLHRPELWQVNPDTEQVKVHIADDEILVSLAPS